MLGWWRRLWAAPPPSAYLFRHLNGTGSGYDLDDLLTRHANDDAYRDVIDTVHGLIARHGDPALGTPAAQSELRLLAMRLATKGR